MGILKEMFSEGDNGQPVYQGEFLAKGSYESKADEILKGYKTYQKKYVFKSLIWKMLLVALALTSSVMMIMTAEKGEMMPVFCLLVSVSVGVWFITQPINNKKNLKKGLDSLEGIKYEAEFYTDKVKISTVSEETLSEEIPQEQNPDEQGSAEQTEADLAIYGENKEEEPPATVIHLDSPIVDLLEKEDMFILVVKKSYVFIIPKTAFTAEENTRIREKLSVIMGIRYKV